jgi:pSer/pThr/pTyr-binding forkhead associated (FHA) protein
MYKYSCRECPIRQRCIDQSDTAARVKEMIRNAFAARTDTLSTWGVLQKNCLLVKADEEEERRANQESLLSRRLREAKKQATGDLSPETAAEPPPPPQPSSPEPSWPQAQARSSAATHPIGNESRPGSFTPAQVDDTTVTRRPVTGPFDRRLSTSSLDPQLAQQLPAPCWLTVTGSGRHIALPDTGQLVLGRFDPESEHPPDVDLTYEDRYFLTVSRQHAKIVGVNGRYSIKDLGSSNGLFLNNAQVTFGISRQLQPGDRIALGQLQLSYDKVPDDFLDPAKTARLLHYLLVSFNGRKILIAPSNNIIIGRSSRPDGPVPEIDLKKEGEVADRVADHHAAISWRNDNPYLEDLGSPYGTRLNGESLTAYQAVPLRPGDHIWLGGCVLGYDIRKG